MSAIEFGNGRWDISMPGQRLRAPTLVNAAGAWADELAALAGIRQLARIEEATALRIRRPLRTWAGLRSFVPNGELVGGFDAAHLSFFWCCGQGGYGIQTAPAMGEACAARILGTTMPEHVAEQGLGFADLAPRP